MGTSKKKLIQIMKKGKYTKEDIIFWKDYDLAYKDTMNLYNAMRWEKKHKSFESRIKIYALMQFLHKS